MRIAEYKQIDTKRTTETILVDDLNEMGEVIGQHEETITKEIPIMGMVYRDATDEEIAESERLAESMPTPPMTAEERIAELEDALIELAELIGG